MIILPNNSKPFEFQEKASMFLLNNTGHDSQKKPILLKSPTGSGKTVILLNYIDKFYEVMNQNISFIWLSIGQGDLEEQSKEKMQKFLPNIPAKDLTEAIREGFNGRDVTFINWEAVTNKTNNAIKNTEKKNIYKSIASAHRKGIDFIVIIDEEHYNKTIKAMDFINRFAPINEIRVSATTIKDVNALNYEIEEDDVVNSQLVTRVMYINDDIHISEGNVATEHEILIDNAMAKQTLIKNEYQKLNKNINPLILIQLPNNSEQLVKQVENYLLEKNISHNNKKLATWFADEKINTEGIEEDNASPIILLCKQAISTGWDCPRAKILVKLRDNMSETFELQTLGRIRRMPGAMHYNNDILDSCYLYTFDEAFKDEVVNASNSAFERELLDLKEKPKEVTIIKELKNQYSDEYDEREVRKIISLYLRDYYNLTDGKSAKVKENNKVVFDQNGFNLDTKIRRYYIQGKYYSSSDISKKELKNIRPILFDINTHNHGRDVMHIINELNRIIPINDAAIRSILKGLFHRDSKNIKDNLINLNNKEWYAFIINNREKLKEIFRKVKSDASRNSISIDTYIPKEIQYRIPEKEYFIVDPQESFIKEITNSAYYSYKTNMVTKITRSVPEILFEKYCSSNPNVNWFYKNGDKGEEYFSIVYIDNFNKAHHFFIDYILEMKNGDIWLIEVKGGEKGTRSTDRDDMSHIKFNTLSNYAKRHNLKWGFVRDRDNLSLYMSNTEYTESLQSEHWKPIQEFF